MTRWILTAVFVFSFVLAPAASSDTPVRIAVFLSPNLNKLLADRRANNSSTPLHFATEPHIMRLLLQKKPTLDTRQAALAEAARASRALRSGWKRRCHGREPVVKMKENGVRLSSCFWTPGRLMR
jgi:hypothetical protein